MIVEYTVCDGGDIRPLPKPNLEPKPKSKPKPESKSEPTSEEFLKKIHDSESPEAFFEALDNAARSSYAQKSYSFRDLIDWCTSHPNMAFAARKSIDFYTSTYTISNDLHDSVCKWITAPSNNLSFPPDANVEFNIYYNPRGYRFCGSLKELEEMVSKFVTEKNLQDEMSKIYGQEMFDEFDDNTKILDGICFEGVSGFCERGRIHKSVGFKLKYPSQLAPYAEELLKRVSFHNMQQTTGPRNKSFFVVTKTGSVKWTYGDYDNMPTDVVSFSEIYMSYFIGPKGANIKLFNDYSVMGHSRIQPLCLAKSPMLPVIITTQAELTKDQHARVLDYLKTTLKEADGRKDFYEDLCDYRDWH